jgi:hypothetical protein
VSNVFWHKCLEIFLFHANGQNHTQWRHRSFKIPTHLILSSTHFQQHRKCLAFCRFLLSKHIWGHLSFHRPKNDCIYKSVQWNLVTTQKVCNTVLLQLLRAIQFKIGTFHVLWPADRLLKYAFYLLAIPFHFILPVMEEILVAEWSYRFLFNILFHSLEFCYRWFSDIVLDIRESVN